MYMGKLNMKKKKNRRTVALFAFIFFSLSFATTPIVANSETTQCVETSEFSSIPIKEGLEVQIRTPIRSSDFSGVSTLFLDSKGNSIRAYLLYRVDGVWKADPLNPRVQISEEGGQQVLDFSGVLGKPYHGARRMLIVLIPRDLRGNFTITPVLDATTPQGRIPIFYQTQSTSQGLISHFDSLKTPIGHNLPINLKLSDMINLYSASGDILIPNAYERKVQFADLEIQDIRTCSL